MKKVVLLILGLMIGAMAASAQSFTLTVLGNGIQADSLHLQSIKRVKIKDENRFLEGEILYKDVAAAAFSPKTVFTMKKGLSAGYYRVMGDTTLLFELLISDKKKQKITVNLSPNGAPRFEGSDENNRYQEYRLAKSRLDYSMDSLNQIFQSARNSMPQYMLQDLALRLNEQANRLIGNYESFCQQVMDELPTSLLASIIRNTEAQVTVLALIGERGREVREFIEKDLGPEGMRKSVVVCSTSDRSAMERLKAAYVATSIAEFFRDKGEKVLLLMDSVTRFGRAQREIGLAAGEPPTRRGFPPSVFSELPKLMERAGNSDKGSITALYTVLVEGDDMTEPIADETRSILDGHIILSRKLAQKNHYPAIDVLQSVSRCQSAIIEKDHKAAAAKLREILAKYAEVELLLKIGEYQKGADPSTDEAIAKIDAVNGFLRQGLQERPSFEETIAKLKQVVS